MGIVTRLAALRRDTRGNSLPIFAASLIPLLAIVGGGVDAARGYLTKVQLQNACDAGVLAGRRAMAKSGDYQDEEKAKALRMFRANFDSDIVEATDINFDTNAGTEGDVLGTASTEIPTVLMQLFGYYDMSFDVTCAAELQITNTDIMFVLDVTGSMAGSRIVGLRDAVRDFHRTITSSVTDDDVRVRYGFVPYSMTVNARRLLLDGDMPADFIADTAPYQTQLAYFETPSYRKTGSSTNTVVETYGSAITDAQCTAYANNNYPSSGSNPVNSGAAPGNTTEVTYSKNNWTRTSGSGTSAQGTCKRNKKTVTTSWKTVYEFDYWRYDQATVDISALKTFNVDRTNFNAVQFVYDLDQDDAYAQTAGFHDLRELALMADTNDVDRANYTWGGCIEERATVVDADMDPVPDGATDLDINSAPDSDETRWKPYFSPLVFYRYGYYNGVNTSTDLSPTQDYCPAPMRLFEEVDLTPNTIPAWLEDYLTSLTPVGGTYHDIGMIWGGRLASPNGIFADIVNDEPERSVSRHVIFMTDGEMAPEIDYYSAYGMERYDNRVAPRDTSRNALPPWHNARFVAACKAIKDEGYTVWVIGFGSSLTSEMRACATGHRAYFSNNSDELRATFRFIASQVADLRLNE